MAIIELENITGLLEATMSDYLDSAVIKEKTTRKELVSLLQATDESLDTVLNNMEGKVASINTLQHHLDVYELENSKLSQELQDTAEKLAKVEAVVKSLEHDLGEAVLEKNNAEEREAEVKLERDNYKLSFEGTFSELKILKDSYNLALDQLDLIRGENTDLRESLEGYKSRGFFARLFNW
jgi:chromosome segregation ATPase